MCSKHIFQELLYNKLGYSQNFAIDEMLVEKQTKFQKLLIFKNKLFGTVMALDGVVQITEKDEYSYQEMISHVPLCSFSGEKKVLIIGGGDGAVLKNVLMHESVTKVVMVEIDEEVVQECKKHFKFLNQDVFDDTRTELKIDDGIAYVTETNEKFDVIIVDSTDPENVGEVLFTKEFYKNAKRILNKGGILVNQSGVPFMQTDELKRSCSYLKSAFNNVNYYVVAVPTYVGGFMCLGFASDTPLQEFLDILNIQSNYHKIKEKNRLNYYNPEIHISSFSLPNFIKNITLKDEK